MRHHKGSLLAAFSILLLVSFGSVMVADDMKAMSLSGDLLRVDADSHTIVVRDSEQKEIAFSYNDKTEISGGIDSVEGLAGKTGMEITVFYKKEGTANIATKLEVHPKQSY